MTVQDGYYTFYLKNNVQFYFYLVIQRSAPIAPLDRAIGARRGIPYYERNIILIYAICYITKAAASFRNGRFAFRLFGYEPFNSSRYS